MMDLLVSVRSAEEAASALEGGAALIDIKEPVRGSLGRADANVIAPLHELVPLMLRNAPSLAMPLPLRVKASAPTAILPWICSAAPTFTVVPPAVVPSAVAF